MSTLSIVSATLRRSGPLQQSCHFCAKRQASRSARAKRRPTLEVELTTDVANLGVVGQRVQVAPGRMRNHLYPSKMALYVQQGRALALNGSLLAPRLPPKSVTQPEQSTSAASAPALDVNRITEQLDLLEPIVFQRLTTGEDLLHGSVTVQNLLSELQDRGIQLTEIEGEWQGKGGNAGIEHGKIKRTGEYTFNVRLQQRQCSVNVHVVKQEAA